MIYTVRFDSYDIDETHTVLDGVGFTDHPTIAVEDGPLPGTDAYHRVTVTGSRDDIERVVNALDLSWPDDVRRVVP